ncbi:MAG: adhC [Mycobacterium sp.]|nr:adhC [Mycobacterium sp.]
MKSTAAVLWERNAPWSVEEIELDAPRHDEVLIELHASGMCHSDDHIVTGDMPFRLPCIGGHEGSGVVLETGANVNTLAPGDHVVFSFMPSCGRCPSCATGHQGLCDLGAKLYKGRSISDGTARHRARGEDLATACGIGSFAHHTVAHESSVVKIEPQHSLITASLLSCGFITGWGSAVYAADIRPGDAVAVAGIGGIGAAAIQGAKLSGAKVIVAIEPVASKKDLAMRLGATHVATSWEEAPAIVAEATWNRGVDKFICAMGVGDGRLMSQVMSMIAKRGRAVITNIHRAAETTISLSLHELTLTEKQIVGTLYGSANARADIPKMLELASLGLVDLEVMVSKTYALEDVNEGYADLRAGLNLRGVLVFPPAQADIRPTSGVDDGATL